MNVLYNAYRMFAVAALFALAWGALPCSAQYSGVEEIDSTHVRAWHASTPAAYQGLYGFGFSEAESTFLLIVEDSLCVAQIRAGYWVGDGEQWMTTYTTLKNVAIRGTSFSADSTTGDFVAYVEDGDTLYGLRIRTPWSASIDTGSWEIGTRYEVELQEMYSGSYTFASWQMLTPQRLAGYSKAELRLMRNEIAARYGYIFTKGSDMDAHFRAQDWYTPLYRDISPFLTDIEKKNIATIRRMEQE